MSLLLVSNRASGGARLLTCRASAFSAGRHHSPPTRSSRSHGRCGRLSIVRPGGAILATVPAFVPLTPDVEDYWHASAEGWRLIAERVWADCDTSVDTHGNCLAAVAAMYGVAVEELTPAELDVTDPRYPVLVSIDCRVAE